MSSLFLRDEPIGGKAWYTLHVKPHKEMQVYRYLRSSGHNLDVYYPSFTINPVNSRSSRVRPYFPRYLFVEAILDELGEKFLQWIPGSVGLVRFGGEPAIVPENFVHELKRRVVEFQKADALPDDIQAGDQIRVESGPFADCEGVFHTRLSGEERVQGFLEWLGRRVTVTMNGRDLRKVRN